MRTITSALAGAGGGFVGALIGGYAHLTPGYIGLLAATVAFIAVLIARRARIL
jgi:hypothetical protein